MKMIEGEQFMFGCGKFDELKILKYIDGTASQEETAEIEHHLKYCEICLSEILELNRIDAELESSKPEKLDRILSLTLKISKSTKEKIVHALSSEGQVALNPLLQVRNEELEGAQSADFFIQKEGIHIRILPAENQKYWLVLNSDKISRKEVLIRKKGATMPLVKRNGEEKEMIFKGIDVDDYQLQIGELMIDLNLREKMIDEMIEN